VNTYSRLTPSRSFKKEVNSSVAIYIPGGTVHLNSRSPKIFILSMMWRGPTGITSCSHQEELPWAGLLAAKNWRIPNDDNGNPSMMGCHLRSGNLVGISCIG